MTGTLKGGEGGGGGLGETRARLFSLEGRLKELAAELQLLTVSCHIGNLSVQANLDCN